MDFQTAASKAPSRARLAPHQRIVQPSAHEHRQELGVQPPGHEFGLYVVPLGAGEPLWHELCELPCTGDELVECDFQPSGDPAPRAYLQDLRVFQVSPERPACVLLHVPRKHDRSEWRLG